MTHAELVQRAKRWLLNTERCAFAFTEKMTVVFQTPDALGFKSFGQSIMVECKVSRSDFLVDKKKRLKEPYRDVLGRLRYYMVPDGLVKVEEVPPEWGLLYVKARQVKVIRRATARQDELVEKNERCILISMLRRVHLRGKLDELLALPLHPAQSEKGD